MILLDTNVISETTKHIPDASVLRFLSEQEHKLHLSVLTLAELHRGAALLQPGRRRDVLFRWIAIDLPDRFAGRILSVGQEEAPIWGKLMVQSRRQGLNLQTMDSLIAATALAHEFTLATRNRKHFGGIGLTLIDPWSG